MGRGKEGGVRRDEAHEDDGYGDREARRLHAGYRSD